MESTVHYLPQNDSKIKSNGNSLKVESPFDDFHLYALEWSEEKFDFFYDDIKYHSIPLSSFDDAEGGNPFRLPHYLLINLAIGGGWGGPLGDSVLPVRYEIDYVRFFKHKSP